MKKNINCKRCGAVIPKYQEFCDLCLYIEEIIKNSEKKTPIKKRQFYEDKIKSLIMKHPEGALKKFIDILEEEINRRTGGKLSELKEVALEYYEKTRKIQKNHYNVLSRDT